MPQMVLNRDHTLISTLGHIITFKKGQPVGVPYALIGAARDIGATSVDDDIQKFEEGKLEVEKQVEAEKQLVAGDPEYRKKKLFAAFAQIIAEKTTENFDALNKPHAATVSKLAGFRVEVAERNEAWAEYLASNPDLS